MTQPQSRTFILVLGLGVSGLAMARWCLRQGWAVRVADTREQPPQLAVLRARYPQVEFVSGAFDSKLLLKKNALETTLGECHSAHAVYCSPGLSPQMVEPVLSYTKAHNIFFGGELDLFQQGLKQLYAEHGYTPVVLAITGTNGKTTVTKLTQHLLQSANVHTQLAGNVGPSLLDTLNAEVDRANELVSQTEREIAQTVSFAKSLPQVWVLELSSFQLYYNNEFEPTAAVILNVSQDHLHWHGDLHSYFAAKSKIFGKRTALILNRDDELIMRQAEKWLHIAQEEGKKRSKKPTVKRQFCTFGFNLPEQIGDWGVQATAAMDWFVHARASETQVISADQMPASSASNHYLQKLLPTNALRIRGRHNACNALAALALASHASTDLAHMLHGLRDYQGEPHRVQFIAQINEVDYFDDSKGTNIGATLAALIGLGAQQKLVVILGGDGKGQDFSLLAQAVQTHARAVVLIGRDAEYIEKALEGIDVTLRKAVDMEKAVHIASQLAHAGDGVLLSPACASMDMFRDYVHRAAVFVACVRDLAEQAGQTLEVRV